MKYRVILSIIMVLSLTFCSSCSRKPNVQVSHSLKIVAAANPLTLNPLFIRDSASAEVAALLYPSLLSTSFETLEVEPRLFSEWEISEDGKTYLFKLSEDTFWSDGMPLTAWDVAFTIRIICHHDYTGWLFPGMSRIEGASEYKENRKSPLAEGEIRGIKVLSDKELEICLSQTFSPFLTYLDLSPLPLHVLGDVAVRDLENHAYSLSVPVGSGPYLLSEWLPDRYLHVRANRDYYLGEPKIEEIYYIIIPNQETQLLELLTGQVDLVPTTVKVEDVDQLKKESDLAVYSHLRLSYDYLGFNLKKKDSPLSDRRVRQALSMLLNRDEIVNNLLLGFGQEAKGPLSPYHYSYDPDFTGHIFNPVAARKLLLEAGYPSLRLKLVYNAGNSLRENVALIFKEQAAAAGIYIDICTLEWEAFLQSLQEGDYDVMLLGCGTGVDPDLTFHWHSQSPGNIFGYANSEVDKLLEKAVETFEKEERTFLYRQAQKLIVKDAPVAWLYNRKAVHAVSARLKNFQPHPENLFYNVHQWQLIK